MSQQTTIDKVATKSKRVADPEIQAMAKIDELLAELDRPQAHRIIAWLEDRYGMPKGQRPQVNQGE